MNLRICTGCNAIKPASPEFFHRHKAGPDGLALRCKECRKKVGAARYEKKAEEIREYTRQYRKRNPEKLKATHKSYYQRNADKRAAYAKAYREKNSDAVKANSARYYAANREKLIEQARQRRLMTPAEKRAEANRRYRLANSETVKATNKAWREANPQVVLANNRNRKARLRAAPGKHTAQDVRNQLERQGHLCHWCKVPLGAFHVDHIIPLIRGGSNGPENICFACPDCNLSKKDKLPSEWSPR